MSVDILGSRPFAGVGDRFTTAADNLRRVGDDLDGLGKRLGDHAFDARTIAADAGSLRASVDEIDASLAGPAGVGLGTSLAVVRIVLVGLLVWLGVAAGGCVLVGRRLLAVARAAAR
jgi:hypothetical protein